MLIQLQYAAIMAINNPFLTAFNELMVEFKGWILGAIGTVTLFFVAKNGLKYQKGSKGQKQEAWDDIVDNLQMGGGIFFLVWVGSIILNKFAGVK